MDPIANLVEQLLLVQQIQGVEDAFADTGDMSTEQTIELAHAAGELATFVKALHEWRVRGGFDPYGSFASRHEVNRLAKQRGWKG